MVVMVVEYKRTEEEVVVEYNRVVSWLLITYYML